MIAPSSPLTFRRASLVLILGVSAFLRLGGLDREPLSVSEASNAWFSWSLAQSHLAFPLERLRPEEPSALLGTLHWLTAVVGFDSDTTARLPGAVAGMALAILPLFFVRRLGWSAATLLAALIATDPVLVATARREGGVALGLLAFGLAMVALFPEESPKGEVSARRRTGLWSAALGVLLAAGWVAWASIPWLVLACLWRRREISRGDAALALLQLRGAMLLAVAILASSAALFAGPLVPGIAASLTSFLRHWVRGCEEASGWPSIGAVFTLDPIALLGGMAALLYLVWPGKGVRRTPVVWILAPSLCGAALLVVTRGAPEALPLAVLPLLASIAIAAGQLGGAGAETWSGKPPFVELIRRPARAPRLILVAGALAISVSAVLAARIARGVSEPSQIGPWSAPADAESRILVRDLDGESFTFGRRRLGDNLIVQLAPWPDPLLGWYLRRFDATWINGPISAASAGVPSTILTAEGSTPWEWIPHPAERPLSTGRSYRIRSGGARQGKPGEPGARTVTLWSFNGGGGGSGSR